jgi:hypothetical protein
MLALQFAASGANYYYDSAGHLIKVDYGAAGVVVYSYDSAGNLVNRQLLPQQLEPLLSITSSHTGKFMQGQMNAIYTITVLNSGPGPTVGVVTVTDTLPVGLTLVSMAGPPGWSCTGAICTRSDALAAGANYPAITATVNVALNAPALVTNQVGVSGGGATDATGSDPTTITELTPQTITFGFLFNVTFGVTPFAMSATASSGLAVSFVSTTTSVCTVSGSTVTIVAPGTCSITASQAGNANYAAATSVTQTFTVQMSQTITFDTIPNQILGISPFEIVAQASSQGPITFTSSSPAVCKISTGLVMLLGAGTCSITASQGGSDSYSAATSVTRSFSVKMAKPSIGFRPAQGSPFVVGEQPETVAVGDFNGDGIPDLAAADDESGTVSVLLGNGAGGFTAAPGSPFLGALGIDPIAIVVGDFNGDGIQDIATVDVYNGISSVNNYTLITMLGNGSGGFTVGQASPSAVGDYPTSLAVGDFNGDGIQDLAIANANGSEPGDVQVLLGNGSGGFTVALGSPFGVGTNPHSIVVGDFNGDGIQDLATANFQDVSTTPPGPGYVTVLLGYGSGGFTVGGSFVVGANPYSIAAGDFNGDGIQDLATANLSDNNVTVLLGNGSLGFTAAPGSPFTVGTAPMAVVVGDFNGDGIEDLATANEGSNNVTVLVGNRSGGFTASTGSRFTVGTAPTAVVVGDFNGDGIEDLATANEGSNNVTVLLGTNATLSSIAITPANPSIIKGATQQFTATGTYSDSSTQNLTASVTWTSGTTTVATINAAGLATGVGAGTSSITASLGGITSPADVLTVTPATLSSIAITPANPSIIKGATQQFTATGTYSDRSTQNLTASVTWNSGTTTVATISAAGLATGVGVGTSGITASLSGVTSPVAVLTVTPSLTSIAVTPANPSIGKGATQQFAATGKYSDSSTQNLTASVTWNSGTTTVATVNASGLATGVGLGTSNITASLSGVTSPADVLTVTPATLSSIAITPANPSIIKGATQQFAATGKYSDSSTQNLTASVAWHSGTTTVATINAVGLATGVGLGTSNITASLSGVTSPADVLLVTGATLQTITFGTLPNVSFGVAPFVISATASSGLAVSFASTTTSVCTVSGTTVTMVTIVALGTCSITASQKGNATYSAAISVTQTLTVSQTITFDAIPNQIFGISPFDIVANSFGLPIAFTSTTQTVCEVSSGLVMLLDAGTCSITASPGGNVGVNAAASVTRSFSVAVAKPSSGFTAAPGSPFAVGNNPTFAVVGDFNGDGIEDLATANLGSSNSNVTVLLGNGVGGFTEAAGSPFTVGAYPYSAAVGDFNGDGIQDLAVANRGSDSVTVLLGNGSGGFTAAPGSPFAVGQYPESVVVGNFNGDGIQDLAVVNQGYDSNNVTVLLGNGSGGFTAAPGSPFAVGYSPTSAVVGDFNGDSIQDLAVVNQSSSGNVTVLLGNGSGGFTAAPGSPFAVGDYPTAVVVGDFNRDGIQDLATANYEGENVTVLLGNGSGGFTAAPGSPFAVGGSNTSLVVGDFNGDGIEDLATDGVTVLLGNGSGGFTVAAGSPFAVGTEPESVVVGDFNGDGIEDLATANYLSNTVTVLLGGPPATLSSIAITPANPSISKGVTQQFTATGTYSDSSTQNLTASVTWTSGTTAVATINAAGLATGVGPGTSNITASLSGVTSPADVLTVTPATLSSIAITPANPSIIKGATQQFTATGTYSDSSTQNLTASVTWTSGTTTVATINADGLATGVGAGTSNIFSTASLSGVTSPANVLTVTPATLSSIAITPSNPSIIKGATEQFTATGTYSDSSTQNLTASVTWSSGTTAVATINAAGLATGVGPGTSSITASLSGVTSPADVLTVLPATLSSIAITPANPSISKGVTQQFTATGTYSDSSTQNLTASVTWSSGTTAVATINAAGLATGVGAGTSSITASLSGITSPTDVLTVTPATLSSIAITPANPSISKGATQQFTATGTYSDSSTQNLTASVTWSSGTTAVATINAAGLATGVGPGTSSITASLSGVTFPADVLTVTPATLSSIAITPANPSISKGATQQFTATGTYSDSSTQNLTASVTWTSGTTTVATINAAGLATGVGPGTSSITASLSGVTSSADLLTVTPATLSSIAITPANPLIIKGATQQFTATGTYSDSSTQNLTASVTWSSGTTTVVTINAAGLATGVGAGTSSITASLNGVTSPADVLTVTLATIALATSPAGLLISVDGGAAQAAPFTVNVTAGSHTVSVDPTQAGGTGIQFVFMGWSDSGAASHSITVNSSSPPSYTATFKTQYQLTAAASPAVGGTLTPLSGTFYDAGSVIGVQATSNAGYQFANFSGGPLTGSTNPQNLTMNGPANIVANFTPLAPNMAVSVGTRTVSGSTVLVSLTLTNTGLAAATNATITSITAISDVVGSGAVTLASGTPVNLGTINPGSSATGTVTLNWPSTATRVSFTVNFTADGGYTGSSKITTLY